MDVVLIPVGRDSALMMTSHRGRWAEVSLNAGWLEPRAGWWSGEGRGDAGPFRLWQAHRSYARLRVWYREGQLIMPRTAPGGPVAYDGAHDRAVNSGYPGVLSNGDPRWVMLRSWELATPLAYPLALAAALPLCWLAARTVRRSRANRRLRAGLCTACEYDLRGSAERCPECGLET